MLKKNFCLVCIIVSVFVSCQKQGTVQKPLVETRFLLGSPLIIKVFDGGNKTILKQVFDEIEKIEKSMTTSKKDYEISEIIMINNASKNLDRQNIGRYNISNQIAEVLKKSLYIAKTTNGAFDPTIEPLVALWGWGSGQEKKPLIKEINETLPLVDWKQIIIQTRSQDSTKKELIMGGKQSIDVGGIAKGYAADQARQMLIENGVKSVIIDFGGNIITVGHKAKNMPWKIGIQEPFSNLGNVVMIIETEETAVVTSGIYERFFEENGKKYSHLINPKTGMAVDNGIVSLTILCKESVLADGFSTGAFILGLEKGMEIVEQTAEIEAIYITTKKEIYTSSGIKHRNVTITNEKYQLQK